ncbi:MAG: hypothetical protein M1838_000479 [Thelocarpon superellum]|nr:MAG: hypothetical protein M1838_000479 [Thelocarpon superellum]
MFYVPSLRRLLVPVLLLLTFGLFYKSRIRMPSTIEELNLHLHRPIATEGIRVPIASLPLLNISSSYLSPPKNFYYTYSKAAPLPPNGTGRLPHWAQPVLNPHLETLFRCPTRPNTFTGHIRLPSLIRNISLVPPSSKTHEAREYWNPTIISLPSWSENQYLLVSRVVTDGNYQQNILCEARVCYPAHAEPQTDDELLCTVGDLALTGPAGGLRCVTDLVTLSVPPTPAERCDGKYGTYVDLPGFHDPRIFWSGRGEPLMMVNTQSRYACFGLWVTDLRTLYPALRQLLASSPSHPSLGPLMSYPSLTELTRNPPSSRSAVEKNWMLFFPPDEAYLHYEMSPRGGRSFAKLLGGGLTTTNLTDPLEKPCLMETSPDEPDVQKRSGTWHQATNSLRLILCDRTDASCVANADNTVFFAIVHRKHPDAFKLPLRYERYAVVWSAAPPFSMLGISQHPILLANETASGWSAADGWEDVPAAVREGRGLWARFTYTVSIAYAWGRRDDEPMWKNTGYLDDDVLLGIGIDDEGQGFARLPTRDLLQCLRACPGREPDASPWSADDPGQK